ncbi:hypothetical protein KC330_g111 [Hortaea werneckii]|nr:hypothetical protein KC330_g111 [Hortaea werneckii]
MGNNTSETRMRTKPKARMASACHDGESVHTYYMVKCCQCCLRIISVRRTTCSYQAAVSIWVTGGRPSDQGASISTGPSSSSERLASPTAEDRPGQRTRVRWSSSQMEASSGYASSAVEKRARDEQTVVNQRQLRLHEDISVYSIHTLQPNTRSSPAPLTYHLTRHPMRYVKGKIPLLTCFAARWPAACRQGQGIGESLHPTPSLRLTPSQSVKTRPQLSANGLEIMVVPSPRSHVVAQSLIAAMFLSARCSP